MQEGDTYVRQKNVRVRACSHALTPRLRRARLHACGAWGEGNKATSAVHSRDGSYGHVAGYRNTWHDTGTKGRIQGHVAEYRGTWHDLGARGRVQGHVAGYWGNASE